MNESDWNSFIAMLFQEFEIAASYDVFFEYDSKGSSHRLAQLTCTRGKYKLPQYNKTWIPHSFSYRDPLVGYTKNEYSGELIQVLFRSMPRDLFSLLCKLHGLTFSNYDHPVVNLFDMELLKRILITCPDNKRAGLTQRHRLLSRMKEFDPTGYSILRSLPVEMEGAYRVVSAAGWNPMGTEEFLNMFNVMFFHTNPIPVMKSVGAVRGLYRLGPDGAPVLEIGTPPDRAQGDDAKKRPPIPTDVINVVVDIVLSVRKYCSAINSGGYVPVQKLLSEYVTRSIDRNPIAVVHPDGTEFAGDHNPWFSAVINFYMEAAFGPRYSVVMPA